MGCSDWLLRLVIDYGRPACREHPPSDARWQLSAPPPLLCSSCILAQFSPAIIRNPEEHYLGLRLQLSPSLTESVKKKEVRTGKRLQLLGAEAVQSYLRP